MASNIADDADRPRKGDVTPDSQRAKYERGEQGAGSTTISDEMEEEYQKGVSDGQKKASDATPDMPAPTKASPKLTSSGKVAIGAPFVAEVLLISVDSFNGLNNPGFQRRPPLPSQLLVAFAFFGLLGMASGDLAGPAAALGWGVVVATFYSGSSKTPPAIGALNSIGKFFGGSYGVKGSSTAGGTSSVARTSEAGTTGVRL